GWRVGSGWSLRARRRRRRLGPRRPYSSSVALAGVDKRARWTEGSEPSMFGGDETTRMAGDDDSPRRTPERGELRRLLVATDLSGIAVIALQTAALLAAGGRAALRVVHCVPRHIGAKEMALFWDEAASLPGANEYDELRRRIVERLGHAGVTL